MQDEDVLWRYALALVDRLAFDLNLTVVKDGDHRLSREEDGFFLTWGDRLFIGY
jgi:hypothetical protein